MAGIDENGFEIKRVPEIKLELEAALRAALGNDLALTPDTPEGAIVTYFSQVYGSLWEELQKAYNAFNPITATGQTLDNLVWLNGLSRLPALQSTVTLTLTGIDGTVVPENSVVKHSITEAEFTTEETVIISASGDVQVNAKSKIYGEIEANAGTLTVIGSPVNGWESVTNLSDAVIGREAETDEELRARRNASLLIAGSSSLESLISNIARLDGVTEVNGVENFTDITDANGLPPHSFQMVVLGGLDENIGQTIWNQKPAGIEADGNITVPVKDVLGNDHEISFSRPTNIDIYVRANITFPGSVPDDADIVITQNILDYVSGKLIQGIYFGIADDVIQSRLYQPINLSYRDLIVNSLETSTDGVNWDTITIPIEFNERSAWDETRIDLTIA